MSRPSRAELDLEALSHNLALARELAGDARVMAVVKANAYGHGAVTVARHLEPLADALAVACLEEAVELRNAGVRCPVLLLEGVFEECELPVAADLGLWLTVENPQQLAWLEQARLAAPLQCWLKVDTGMNRLGLKPDLAVAAFTRLRQCANVGELVLCTHLASADDLHSDQTASQLAAFDRIPVTTPRSAANSAGLLAWPAARYDWVRPGYMLYGNSPLLQDHPAARRLRPVMTLKSSVISLRDVAVGETVGYGATWQAQRPSRIATVTVGYGDGYPRMAPNGTPVLVRGQRVPLAGRVSMDMLTVDVTALAEVQIGDEVILWGPALPLSEIATWTGTIGYELTTRMPARAHRVVAGHTPCTSPGNPRQQVQ